MSEEWGPWIEHDGSEACPFNIGERVQTVGGYPGCPREMNEWTVTPYCASLKGYRFIDRYRIRKPRGLTILEEIAQGVKQPEDA